MAQLVANFEYPYNSGVPSSTTEFDLGAEIGLLVKDASPLGGYKVSIEWDNKDVTPYFHSGNFSFEGNANIPIVLPNVATKGVLTIQDQGLLDMFGINSSKASLNLGVGTAADATGTGSSSNTLGQEVANIIKWGAIALAVVGVVYVASKAAPSVATGIAKTKKASQG